MKQNYIKYITGQVVISCINIFITGTVLQTFLLESGVGEHAVSVLESTILIIQSLVMAVSSRMVEKMKNILNSYAVTTTLRGIVILPMLLLCVVRGVSAWLVFTVVVVFKFIGTLFDGVYSVVCYKLPYHVIEMKDYGRMTALGELMSGVFATALSASVAYLNARIGFFNGMKYVLCFGLVSLILGFFIIRSTKQTESYKANVRNTQTDSKESIFHYKPFYLLLIPNFCRGICTGVLNVALVIGYHFKIIDGSNAFIVTVILQITTILGTILYAFLCNKILDGTMILAASALVLAAMPFMANLGMGVFLTALFVARLATVIIGIAIPVAVVKIVNYTYIGRYSAWRMIVHTLGTALGSGTAIVMTDALGGITAMLISGLCMVLCGVAYYICLKAHDK